MGRVLTYLLILALAAFLLAAALVLRRGGGDPTEAVTPVSVHDLSAAPHIHAEERVTTSGVLRIALEPEEHFLITDEGLGVVVRYDAEALRQLVEREVTVTGRFGFDSETGVYIEADSVTPSR